VGASVAEFVLQDTRVKLNDFLPSGLTPTWTIKLCGKLTVEKTAAYELGLTVAGRAKLYVDGKMMIDNWTKQTPGDFFYGLVIFSDSLQSNQAHERRRVAKELWKRKLR
jgi:beta-glucosidase